MSETAPSDSDLPVTPAGDGSALIFDWSPPRWRRTRLLFFIGLAAGGHLLLFYLFRVATPPVAQGQPPVRSTMLLPSSIPSAAALVQRKEDEYPELALPMPLRESDAAALHRLVKGYEPTWQRHAARLKPLPDSAEGGQLPSVTPSPPLLLPPLPAAEAVVAVSGSPANSPSAGNAGLSERAQPVLFVQSGLAGRSLLGPPVWPPDVTQPDWPADGPASFLISVNPEGKVLSCLPLSTASFDIDLLRRPILALRFSPRQDSDEVSWGWLDVQW